MDTTTTGSEAWSLMIEDVGRFPVFGHGYLHGIGRICLGNLMSISEVRRNLLDPRVQSLEKALHQNKLRCLGGVLRMSAERMPRCTLFSEVGSGWRMG